MRTKADIGEEFEDIYIKNPEIKYIFTIDLKGRINTRADGNLLDKIQGYYTDEQKINIFSNDSEIFTVKMTDSFVQYYVDKYFLEHSTPIRWIFSNILQRRIIDDAIKELITNSKCNGCHNKDKCSERLSFGKNIQRRADSCTSPGCFGTVNICDENYNHSIAGIEIKLFSQGSIGILLRFNYVDKISVRECVGNIRYPENITIKKDECYIGPLNILAFKVARKSLESLLSNASFTNFNEFLRESFESFDEGANIINILHGSLDNFEKSARLHVGVLCSGIYKQSRDKEIDLLMNSDETIPEIKNHVGRKIAIALANNTPEFLKHFNEPFAYINNHNIARGEEIILIERRGWLVVSPRIADRNESVRFRLGIVASLIYSIETIFATTLTIETFNENLEIHAKPVSKYFNKLLTNHYSTNIGFFSAHKQKRNLYITLKKFLSVIAKARSLSPCEDITTSMEAHVISQTSIKAIIKLKSFGLIDLIELARLRMRNYGYFLQTGHEVIMEEQRKTQNFIMMIVSITMLILTIISALNLVDTNKSKLQLLTNLQNTTIERSE